MKFYLFMLLFITGEALAFNKVKLEGKIYIPEGFDDNDSVEITTVGILPNSCYRNPTFSIERKTKSKAYLIRLYAFYVPNPNGCKEVSTPYFDTINFGMMEAGDYEVTLVKNQSSEVEKLSVGVATSSLVDDYNYGQVTGIIEDKVTREITLIGVNPTDCMKFDKISAVTQSSTIILMPLFKETGFCKIRHTPFKIKYQVPFIKDGPQGILIHVRVMNGRSFNYLYQNRI